MEDDGRIIIYKSAWNSGTSTGQFGGPQQAHPGCDVGTGTGTTGTLGTGQCFVSPNGHFELLVQPDGNMVLYDRTVTPMRSLWSTGTALTSFSPGIALATRYLYGVLDNLLKVSQGVQTRTYAHDGMGRLTDATTPEVGHIIYRYNDSNQVTQRIDARGVITNYGYDSLNRLKTVGYNVGTTGVAATPPVTYVYGTDPTQNNNGRLLTLIDGLGSETLSYDQLGRIGQVKKVVNGITYSIGYSYNLAGDLTAITYPSGRVVQQSFDAIGRLCEIAPQTSGCGSSSAAYATGYSYNAANELTGFFYGNGVNAVFGYSPDRLQLTNLSYQKGSQPLFALNYY
jgi:YD repeat-containing protein